MRSQLSWLCRVRPIGPHFQRESRSALDFEAFAGNQGSYDYRMPDFHFYEPSQGHNLPHDPFKAIVAPRPIGWISTSDANGRVNLAPYSFFNAVCDQPPMVMFSSGGWKDSVANIQATGEFVCNLVTRALAGQMNQTSA